MPVSFKSRFLTGEKNVKKRHTSLLFCVFVLILLKNIFNLEHEVKNEKKKIWIEVNNIPKNIECKDKLIIPFHKFIREDRLIEILDKKGAKK